MKKEIKNSKNAVAYTKQKQWKHIVSVVRKRLRTKILVLEKPNNSKKKLYSPFLWMGFNCLKATATLRRQFTFYHSIQFLPRNSLYSFYWPCKDERLSWPWSHLVVLNTGPLDWEPFVPFASRKNQGWLEINKQPYHWAS